MSPVRPIQSLGKSFGRPSRQLPGLTLSSCTFATMALAALAAGCTGDAIPQPAAVASQPGLQLPAGPAAAGRTLAQLGFATAQLGNAGTPMYLSGHVAAAIRNGEG